MTISTHHRQAYGPNCNRVIRSLVMYPPFAVLLDMEYYQGANENKKIRIRLTFLYSILIYLFI